MIIGKNEDIGDATREAIAQGIYKITTTAAEQEEARQRLEARLRAAAAQSALEEQQRTEGAKQ